MVFERMFQQAGRTVGFIADGVNLCRWVPVIVILLLTGSIAVVGESRIIAGDEDQEGQPAKENRAKQRLELMKSLITEIEVAAPETDAEVTAKFAARPLLRYNDQSRALYRTRHLLDATVWRLGEAGRPMALVTLELYPLEQGKGQVSYEFLSLSPAAITMLLPTGKKWSARASELKMSPVADAALPADSPAARLAQMRQLARRFSVHEDLQGEKVECRLLSQPIDRYSDAADDAIRDGAIFVFANGTNPEAGLILECSERDWAYGLFRLSSAAVFAEIDGKPCFEAPAMGGYPYPLAAPYTATNGVVELAE